jgi:hypothetical protein
MGEAAHRRKEAMRVDALLSLVRLVIIRLHRHQYRLDLKTDLRPDSPCTVADEADHVLAIVKKELHESSIF